jgi:RNA polymerase sigma-70 factor (ECF subfamily)
MTKPKDKPEIGLFEARYTAFLETLTHLRPRLHRYCTRMIGSPTEGEDVMQEALFEAYRKLDMLGEDRALAPWLFAIAHNRCIDTLRRRKVRARAEAVAAPPDLVDPTEPVGIMLGPALERMVIHLPPKERACLLLKDVFDHSLEEIAPMVQSTVGGVKSALVRARRKMALMVEMPAVAPVPSPETRRLLELYIDRFNNRDWDGVRELTSADARLRVADCFAGRLADSPYFVEYERPMIPWRMQLGAADGEVAVIILNAGQHPPTPWSLIRLSVAGGKVVRIDDYIKTPWVLQASRISLLR